MRNKEIRFPNNQRVRNFFSVNADPGYGRVRLPAGKTGWRAAHQPLILVNCISITSSSKPFCNSVHKRDENRSERRRLSAGEAAGTPALGKSVGDTRRECPVEPVRTGNRMLRDRKCSAVPEEREPKRSFCRRQTDALPKGGNNPECRRVVPAGERSVGLRDRPFTGRPYAGFQ